MFAALSFLGVMMPKAADFGIITRFYTLRLVLAFRICRKPPLADALPLLEQLADAPQRREGNHAEQRRPDDVGGKERRCDAGNTNDEKYPPTSDAEVVLRLDDYRVECADDYKRRSAYDESRVKHYLLRFAITESM